jgi:hypothetical protein
MKKRAKINLFLVFAFLSIFQISKVAAQNRSVIKDTIIYRISYKDTTIYKYDTVRVRVVITTDTIRNDNVKAQTPTKRRLFNPNSWGIGPTAGAYYSPFNGFDMNIGFGIQYYLFAVPSFRNPHMKVKRQHGRINR